MTTTPTIHLRDVQADDLPIFFEQQLDADANWMAGFTAPDPQDRAAFDRRWERILESADILKQTIVVDDEIAGSMLQFELFDKPAIGYWIGKAFWGKGVATAALRLFLQQIPTRPIYAHVAHDNHGSIRVLQKCGFTLVASDFGFANARNAKIEEYIFELS